MCKLTISTSPQIMIMKHVECAWDKSVSLKTMTRVQYFNTNTYQAVISSHTLLGKLKALKKLEATSVSCDTNLSPKGQEG